MTFYATSTKQHIIDHCMCLGDFVMIDVHNLTWGLDISVDIVTVKVLKGANWLTAVACPRPVVPHNTGTASQANFSPQWPPSTHLFPELLWTTNTHGCPHTHQPTYLHSNLPISTTNYTLTQQHRNLPTCDQPTFLTWIQDQIYKHMSTHVTCQHACLHTYCKYTSLPTSTSAYTYSSLLHLHPLPPHPYLDLKGSWGH